MAGFFVGESQAEAQAPNKEVLGLTLAAAKVLDWQIRNSSVFVFHPYTDDDFQ